MGSSWKRQCVEEPSYHDDRSMGEHAFLAFTQSERNSVSKLDKFCQSTSKGVCLLIPACDQSQTKRLMVNQPLHVQLAALFLGQFGDDGLEIAILARLHALAIFTHSLDDAGIQARFATHEKESAMAGYVSEIGQIEKPPVGQEQRALQTL